MIATHARFAGSDSLWIAAFREDESAAARGWQCGSNVSARESHACCSLFVPANSPGLLRRAVCVMQKLNGSLSFFFPFEISLCETRKARAAFPFPFRSAVHSVGVAGDEGGDSRQTDTPADANTRRQQKLEHTGHTSTLD